eukprot:GHVU01211373.1.p1 GENE.GHVU01211373.1~~GHVU01211373.1.p1  ORF type:complete len:106 (-),score=2.41 GHVU01211373.1:73-390(-)
MTGGLVPQPHSFVCVYGSVAPAAVTASLGDHGSPGLRCQSANLWSLPPSPSRFSPPSPRLPFHAGVAADSAPDWLHSLLRAALCAGLGSTKHHRDTCASYMAPEV